MAWLMATVVARTVQARIGPCPERFDRKPKWLLVMVASLSKQSCKWLVRSCVTAVVELASRSQGRGGVKTGMVS